MAFGSKGGETVFALYGAALDLAVERLGWEHAETIETLRALGVAA